MNHFVDVRVSREGGVWVIRERNFPNSVGVSAEALVMSCSSRGKGFVDGWILSVHGIPQQEAARLTSAQSTALGVGAHLHGRMGRLDSRRYPKIFLTFDGKITEV